MSSKYLRLFTTLAVVLVACRGGTGRVPGEAAAEGVPSFASVEAAGGSEGLEKFEAAMAVRNELELMTQSIGGCDAVEAARARRSTLELRVAGIVEALAGCSSVTLNGDRYTTRELAEELLDVEEELRVLERGAAMVETDYEDEEETP